MDLKDLNKISIQDLQNIDSKEALDWLKNKPSILIKILLILITIFATIYCIKTNKVTEETLRIKISELKEKDSSYKTLAITKRKYKEFINEFPKGLTANDLIDKLGTFASRNDIEIRSLSPAKITRFSYFNKITVGIKVSANEYTDLIKFIDKIEDAPFAIKLNKFSAKLESGSNARNRNNSQKKDDSKISADFSISAIELKK